MPVGSDDEDYGDAEEASGHEEKREKEEEAPTTATGTEQDVTVKELQCKRV